MPRGDQTHPGDLDPDQAGPAPEAGLGPRVLAGFGWALFLLITIDHVGDGPLRALDQILLEAVPREGALFAVSGWVTHLGHNATLGALTLLGVVLLVRGRRFVDAGVLALGTAVSAVVVYGVKLLLGRVRPVVGELGAVCCSFPSGHSAGSAFVYMMLAVLLFERQRRLQPWVEGVAVGLAVVVGATRVVLGVHWPTDVASGLGLGWGLAGSFLLLRWFFKRRIALPWVASVGEESASPGANRAVAEVRVEEKVEG